MIVVSHQQVPDVPSDPVALRAMDAALAKIEHIAPYEIGVARRSVTGNPDNTQDDRRSAWKKIYPSLCEDGSVAERLTRIAAERACHRQLDRVSSLAERALAAAITEADNG